MNRTDKRSPDQIKRELVDERNAAVSAILSRPSFVNTPLQSSYLRLLGMPRSGTHAVMNWLAPKFGNVGCYIDEKQKHDYFIPPQISQNLPVFESGLMAPIPSNEHKDVLIHGFEWRPCNSVFNSYLEQKMFDGVGGWGKKWNVLILRDPFNLAASMRVKRTDNNWRPLRGTGMAKSFARMWMDHAVYFLDHEEDGDHLCINYNAWFSSEQYRRGICYKIGAPFNDIGLEQVSGYANGSSFDGIPVDGRQMDVLNRWKKTIDDPLYRWLFAKWPELIDMSRIIFGWCEAEDHIFKD